MAELLVAFDTPLYYSGAQYQARAIGAHGADGMWQGWLEFVPVAGGEPVIGSVESTQPERDHIVYWATGLTPVYLEGAFERALSPTTVRVRVASTVRPEAVLDPFDVGRRNLDVLRQELGALNRPRLSNIIDAYELNPGGEDLSWMSDAQLVTFIVTATEAQLLRRA